MLCKGENYSFAVKSENYPNRPILLVESMNSPRNDNFRLTMDIILSKKISRQDLDDFLTKFFPQLKFHLIYEGETSWEDIPDDWGIIIEYLHWPEMKTEYNQGLEIYCNGENYLQFFEYLSQQLSKHFACAACCDASRVVLVKMNVGYSLLFEQDKVILVDDYYWEDTGDLKKIVELTSYEVPICEFIT